MVESSNFLGDLLVEEGVVTQHQLNQALQIQKEQEDRQRIGQILFDLGFLSRLKLREVIGRHGRRERFGELLAESDTITRDQLREALRLRESRRGPLGRILIEMGIVDEDQIAQTLSRQYDIPYMVPRPQIVDMGLFNQLPERFIKAYSVIPVVESDGVVTILLADPTDDQTLWHVQEMLGKQIDLAVCGKQRIDEAIDALLRQKRFGAAADEARELEKKGVSLRHGFTVSRKGSENVEYGERAESIFDYLIYNAIQERASDIHIEPQRDRIQVRYRVDGVLLFRTELPLSLSRPLAIRAAALANIDHARSEQQYEGRILGHVGAQEVDLRVTISSTVFGEALAIRIRSRETGLMELDELGMLPSVLATYRDQLRLSSGVIFFSGPTGSGKTTSLYASLSEMKESGRKIITVEAPVECPIDGTVQNDIPPQDIEGISKALYGALHQDPDVIAVGEIAQDETANSLLRFALMGHKVFSTLHAEDSANALIRLGGAGATRFLASCSMVIVAQRLIRKVCPHCSDDYVPTPDALEKLQLQDFDPDTIDFRSGAGCSECLGTGFLGRTGIYEMEVLGEEMRSVLERDPTAGEVRTVMRKRPGFITLREAGILKAMQGITTLEEVLRVIPSVQLEQRDEKPLTLNELCRKAGVAFEGTLEGDDE